MITKAIVDYSKYTKDTVVVVMWSNNDRETIYNEDGTLRYQLGAYSDAPEVLFIEACC